MAAPSSSFGDCSSKGVKVKFKKKILNRNAAVKFSVASSTSMCLLPWFLCCTHLRIISHFSALNNYLDANQRNGHENDFLMTDYVARRYINQKVEVMIKKHIDGTATNEYLTKLDQPLKVSTGLFDPELIIYSAGTDILDGDPLGRLKISPDGIPMRDERVFRFAREKNIPIVMLKSEIGIFNYIFFCFSIRGILKQRLCFRWLNEIQCQSNRRFHHKFVEEIPIDMEVKKITIT